MGRKSQQRPDGTGGRQPGGSAAPEEEIARRVAEAVGQERRGLRTTLRVCVRAFDEVLALPGVPGGLRAAVRACRGLCLAGLEEGGSSAPCGGRG